MLIFRGCSFPWQFFVTLLVWLSDPFGCLFRKKGGIIKKLTFFFQADFSWTKVYPIIPKPELRGLGGQVSVLYTSRYQQATLYTIPCTIPFEEILSLNLKPPLNTKIGDEFPTQPVWRVGLVTCCHQPGAPYRDSHSPHVRHHLAGAKSSPGGLPWGENVTHFNGASLVTSN